MFGILTRGFILLITEVEIAVEEFADKNATQQGYAQQSLWELMMSKAIKKSVELSC